MVFRDGRTVGLVLPGTALDDSVAQRGRRQAFIVGRAVVMFGRFADMLAIFLVRSIATVVISIADKVQRDAHLASTRKLVDAALLVCAAFVLVRHVAGSAVVIRVAFPHFGNTATRQPTGELIGVTRRVLTEGRFLVGAVVTVAISVANPGAGHATDGPTLELIFATSDVLARATRSRVFVRLIGAIEISVADETLFDTRTTTTTLEFL